MCERENMSHDFFSLAMGPSLNIQCYNGCIINGVKIRTVEHDSQRITQNSRVMVIDESSSNGSGDNHFYGVLNEVLNVQYPMG